MGNGVLRVYQEDWFPFQNLPEALGAFTQETGIKTELVWDAVGVGTIEHMFDRMVESFSSKTPSFDLICTDEIILQDMGRRGLVSDLSSRLKADGIGFDDVTAETWNSLEQDGQVLGLPCINVSSMILYRRDLIEDYGLRVPQDWNELKQVASDMQAAVRRDHKREFYGFETRGAAGGGHAVWSLGSFTGSYGARWIEADGRATRDSGALREALSTYLDLLETVCPPEQGSISFPEMRRDFAAGRVGMIMDVGMEYAHFIASNPKLAEVTGVAMVPAGPSGRAPNLYAPPWSIPANSPMQAEAYELAKYLTSPKQLLQDGLASSAIETSSLSVLFSSTFDRRFRSDLLSVVRASRAVSRQERPFCRAGISACSIVGDAANAALTGKKTADAALADIADQLDTLLSK